MHNAAYHFVVRMLAMLPTRKRVIEFGSRNVNGTVRLLFLDAESYTGLDLEPGEGVDIVADAATYDLPADARAPDTVVCCEVLEHARDPEAIIANAYRLLAPGGVLILTAAGPERAPHSGYDGGPLRPGEHYGGIDVQRLDAWLTPFTRYHIERDRVAGDVYACAWKGGAGAQNIPGLSLAYLHTVRGSSAGPARQPYDGLAQPAPAVSIVIPTYNKWEYTSTCLESLIRTAQTQRTSSEIIVVDNASTDVTRDALSLLTSRVRVHLNETNLGFAKACNQGARLARGRYLLFLNDTEARPGWLDAMIETIESDPSIAVVGSKLLYPDGTIQHGGVVIRRGRPFPISPDHLHRGRPARESDQPLDLNAVTAACLLIRREVFEAIGGFDEGYVNGYEDVDLCFKVKEQGWRIVYTPKSVLVHHESVSPGRHQRDIENLNRLHLRWLGRFTAFDDPPVSLAAGDGAVLPDSHRPGATVIVQISRSLATIASCLDRLLRYTGPQDEILCVQCGPADASLRYAELMASEHPERIRVLWPEEGAEAGVWQALRRAADAATREYIALVRADMAATPGWLDRLVSCLDARPDAGAAGPVSNGVGLQDVGLHLDTLSWPAGEDGWLDSAAARLAERNAGRYLEVSRLHACCLLTRREVLRDMLEHLDPIALSEEPDAAWSEAFRWRGYRLLIATDALVGQAVDVTTPGGRQPRLELPDDLVQSYLQDYTLALLSQIRAAPLDGMAAPEDQACLAQAETLRRQGGLDGLQQAYDDLSARVAQRPESVALRLALADLLLDAGETAAAFAVLAEGITDPPQHAGLYLRLAIAALSLGRVDDARNAFEIALALAPEVLAPTGFIAKAFVSALDLARRAAVAA